MYLLEFFFVLFVIFYLYQPPLVKTFALICLYLLAFAILVILGNCYLFDLWIISDITLSSCVEFSSKCMLISTSESGIFLGITYVGISVGLDVGL